MNIAMREIWEEIAYITFLSARRNYNDILEGSNRVTLRYPILALM